MNLYNKRKQRASRRAGRYTLVWSESGEWRYCPRAILYDGNGRFTGVILQSLKPGYLGGDVVYPERQAMGARLVKLLNGDDA
jgi:hypothetical protein